MHPAPKKRVEMRRSGVRGSLRTKISIAVDALGSPVRLILTARQVADIYEAGA
jgi:hypothetical protein